MSSQGFTFIELLVTIAISGLLLGMGVAAYNNFSDHQKLLLAVRSLKTNLRAAQGKAMANKIPILEDPCVSFEGYRVTFKEDEYKVEAICDGDGVGETEVEYKLPSKIERIIVEGEPEEGLPVLFKPLTAGVELLEEGDLVLTYKREDTDDRATVTITPSGEIK